MTRTRRTVFALIILALMISPFSSFAQTIILNENFERPIGTPFPWQTYGNYWLLHPVSPSQPRWDIERNAIYHQGGWNDVTAAWCVGSLDNLLPGVDPYPANVLTHMYWGPFNTYDAAEVIGSFWMWADVEDNSNGDGDRFMLGIKQGPFSPVVGDWDVLYELDGSGDQTWYNISFDLSEAMSGDSLVNYLEMDDLYIDFIFISDDDNNDHFGVFVDDISMGKYLTGFDYQIDQFFFCNPYYPDTRYDVLNAGQEYGIEIQFRVYGNGFTPEVTHALYDGNNQLLASHRQSYEAAPVGQIHFLLFDEVFTAPFNVSELHFVASLDDLDELYESNEANNTMAEAIDVVSLVNVQLTPHDQDINLPRGENFYYDAEIAIGRMPGMVPGWIWTEAILPNGTTYGPVQQAYMQFWPLMNINVTNIGVTVPGNAPLGDYQWVVNVGPTVGNVYASDSFAFTVIDWAGANAASANDWIMTGMDAFSAEANHAGNEAAPAINDFALNAAYPNPFNPSTTFSVQLPEASALNVTVFNVAGQQVAELANGTWPAGMHPFTFDAANLASGLYFVHATVPGKLNQVQKVMLVR